MSRSSPSAASKACGTRSRPCHPPPGTRRRRRPRLGQRVPSRARPSNARLGARQQHHHHSLPRRSPRRGQRRQRPSSQSGWRRPAPAAQARPPHTAEPPDGSQPATHGAPPGPKLSHACHPAHSHTMDPPAGEDASRRGPTGGGRPAQHALSRPTTASARPPPSPLPSSACRPARPHTVGPPAEEDALRRGPTGSERPAQHARSGPSTPPAPAPAPIRGNRLTHHADDEEQERTQPAGKGPPSRPRRAHRPTAPHGAEVCGLPHALPCELGPAPRVLQASGGSWGMKPARR